MPSLHAEPKKSRIVIGITGGIAAYKACELVRLFRKAHCEVRVVMTQQAENFVGPLTFASLSGNPVLRSLDGANAYDLSATSHIDLAQWGDILVIAPATANALAKLAHGICDDALSTEALAFTNPVLVAPAMNTRMWEAAPTQANLAALRARGVHFAGPISGDLACGEVGEGKMASPEEIFALAQALLNARTGIAQASNSGSAPEQAELFQPLRGMNVLVTSGPTRSYLDSVRFLTNRSSGKMGHAIAAAAEALGARVTLVTGPVDRRYAELRDGLVVKVERNQEMLDRAMSALPEADLIFSVAAVADFAAAEENAKKVSRSQDWLLRLIPTVDILASLAKNRRPGQVFVGFAAEAGPMEEQKRNAIAKLERKGLDLLALNDVSRADIGFDVDANEMRVFERDAESVREIFLSRAPKQEIARKIIDLAVVRWSKAKSERGANGPL